MTPPGRFRIGFVIWHFTLLVNSAGLAMAAEPTPPPPDLAEVGRKALAHFLPALDSATMKASHGFDPADDFKDVTLGEPFEPFYLQRAAVAKYAGGPVTASLTPSGGWYFPVRSRGRVACLVTVAKSPEGKLMEERLGMPELARAWMAVKEAWPAEKNFTPRFVIVAMRQRFYFTVPQAEPPNLTQISIESKDSALSKTYERLTPATATFASLR